MRLGIGLGLTTQRIGEVIAQIITGTAPVIGVAYDGDTVADVVTFTNDYVTTATGPVTIVSQEMNINGAGLVAYNGTTALAEGDTLAVLQNTSDASGNLRTFTSNQVTVLAALTAPTVSTAATFTGTPQVDVLLTGTPATFAGNPVPTVVNEFLMDGVVVATGTTYTPVTGDIDAIPTFRSTATNSQGSIASTSAGGAAVLPALEAPAVATAATFAGTPQVGVLLTGTPATFTGYPVPTVVNTWLMDGVTVATADTYTPVTGDLGAFPIFRSNATNTEGSVVSNSAAGAAVLEASPSTPALFDSVNADGWSATYTSPPTFDPVGSPEYFTVTRSGYDATGTATTLDEDLIVMKRIRLPYPDEASLTTDQVALNDYIYSSDVIDGATNNSTRAYPKPISMWITPDLERDRTGTFVAKLAVAHAHGRNGTPVAAIKFIATDGTNTVEQLVTTPSSEAFASGLTAQFYQASIDTSTLNAATICALDAIIYPWIGNAFQISVDADTYPSANLTVLKFLCDRTGSYGEAYAYVDPAAGGGAAVSADPVAAATTPYTTIALAAAAIKVFNNANYGRNEASGGTVRLVAATHTHSSFAACSATTFPITIESADVADKATTIWTNPTAHIFNGFPIKTKIRNLTLLRANSNHVFLSSGATLGSAHSMLLDNVNIDAVGAPTYSSWIYNVGRLYLQNVSTTSSADVCFDIAAGESKAINAVGCYGGFGASLPSKNILFNAVASSVAYVGQAVTQVGNPTSYGQFFGFNKISDSNVSISANYAAGARGFALVQNIVEVRADVDPALNVWGSGAFACENILDIGNTFVGQRTIWLYNDVGNHSVLSGYRKHSVHSEANTKSDVFASDGLAVGNWSQLYVVGHKSNAYLYGSSAADAVGIGAWCGELLPINTTIGTDAVPVVADWVSDKSSAGDGIGGGDYTPGPSSALPNVLIGEAHYSIDLLGRAIPNDGTATIGAVQPV